MKIQIKYDGKNLHVGDLVWHYLFASPTTVVDVNKDFVLLDNGSHLYFGDVIEVEAKETA